MILPSAVDLGEVMQQSLPNESEPLKEPDGGFIIWHDICFDPVEPVFSAHERQKEDEGFHHVAPAQISLAGLISDHAAAEGAIEEIAETDGPDRSVCFFLCKDPYAQIVRPYEGIILAGEICSLESQCVEPG